MNQRSLSASPQPLEWLRRTLTNVSRRGSRLGISILGTLFVASLGVAIIVVLVTISLLDLYEYATDRSWMSEKKEE